MARSLTKTTRFEVFKRDSFVCQYCGSKPPAVVLEVDHIIPVSGGGTDEDHNLITSCFDCNRGKGARGVDKALPSIAERTAQLLERKEQVEAYEDLLRERRQSDDICVEVINGWLGGTWGYFLTPKAESSVRKHFLSRLVRMEIFDAVDIAEQKFTIEDDPSRAYKYFCGVCWRKIKGEVPA